MPAPVPRRVDARRRLGMSGEAAVGDWYEARGYRVLDRNWRCREGELDLVAGRPGLVVFCEVKTRRGDAYGTPAEAVTVAKQRRLRLLAARWLAAHPDSRGEARFDVAAVTPAADATLTVEVIEAAF